MKDGTKNNLSIILSTLSLIVSFILCFVTFKTYNAQLKQIKNQELPNFKILSIDAIKSYPNNNPSLYDGSYCRIIKGEPIKEHTLNGNLAVFDCQNEQIEPGFIEEIESHIGKNETYFTYFGTKPYLMIVHASSKERYIVDHSNVIITLHNYGAKISALSIKSFTAYYNLEQNINPITFQGDINKKITLSPDENDNFVLYFDEVTTDLNNSLCQITPDAYITSPDYMNLLRTHMVKNELEIKFHCWDLFNNETDFKITIEYNGDFFISDTYIIK